MAQGIELPTQVVDGRLKLLSGNEYIEQLIVTGMGDNTSDNPFLDVGLGESMIFDINDALTDAQIRVLVEGVFDSLEADQLARLSSLTFSSEGGQKKMYVEYENLETGARPELEVPLGGE